MRKYILLSLCLSAGFCLAFIKTKAAASLAMNAATLNTRIVVHAADRGRPYINFEDGIELLASYSGATELQNLLNQNVAEPRSLASADFDEDGVPDLICGYASPGGGIITLHRGNVDSIFQNSPEAQRRKAEGTFTDSAFLSPARAFEAPVAVHFVGAGDFDADGHWDLVAAGRGGKALYLLPGDGRGGFGAAKQIDVPGKVTALASGDVNRADGLMDIIVALSGDDRPELLVLEGPEGAFKSKPEVFSLPAEATSLAVGRFDEDYLIDFAAAAGHELIVVHGRDRKLSLGGARQAEAAQAGLDQRLFAFDIKAITVGDFTGKHETSFALLSSDGTVFLAGDKAGQRAIQKRKRQKARDTEAQVVGQWPDASELTCARVSTGPADDLFVLDGVGQQIRILTTGATGAQQASSTASEPSAIMRAASLDTEGKPVTALPMRLNSDALSDLVILRSGRTTPAVVKTTPAATFTVNKTDDHDDGACDTGDCTLREAINAANNNTGVDAIAFNISGAGVQTISPSSALPAIKDPVNIDGSTQPGFSGTPLIELNGSMAGTNIDAFNVTAGSSVVNELVIHRFSSNGVELVTNGNNIIMGNLVGTDATGTVALGNTGPGIFINGTSNNTIGGMTPAARNVISGNQFGVEIFDSGAVGNKVQGNYIGTDASGTAALGSSILGVRILIGSNNIIGGTTVGAGNVISGNRTGVLLFVGATGNQVTGNLIGTRADGVSPVGNTMWGVSLISASNNSIGGTSTGAGNVIAHNGFVGVGVQCGSSCSVNNAILSNSIFSNNSLGIDLRDDGVTINDPCDIDSGPNNVQNFPVLSSATLNGVSTTIQGMLNSAPVTTFTVQFFSNALCDPSGFGEGQTFIGSTTVTTDSNCGATFSVTLPVGVPAGEFITATATDPGGNTSEFSQCIAVTSSGGTDTAGLYDPATSTFFLRNSNSSAPADLVFGYGPGGAGWIPVVGDWNGNGVDTIGLYDPTSSVFFLRNANSSGPADLVFGYGPAGAGWIPIAGDWNGDGIETIGLYDPATSTFFLSNSNSSAPAALVFTYGPAGAGWIPIAGDWNGDGVDTIGLYDPATSTFFLRNSNSSAPADLVFTYGPGGAGWKPLAGDWNGDGTETIGLYDPASSTFFLRNSNTSAPADLVFTYGPAGAGWIPIAGDWDGL
jgi:CSLREA domain-containing protein